MQTSRWLTMKKALAMFALFILAVTANAQDKSDKFAIYVVGMGDAKPVGDALIKMMNASKPFTVVTKDDIAKVVILVSCMPRNQGAPYGCMYVSQYNGATFKTFMGGGMFVAKTSEDVATNFFGSIAQDIVERFSDMSIDNLRQSLQSCLLLTDTKCNVPDQLQKEFSATQLTLGQFLLKKNQ
jgi:hypothetical protein